MISVPQIKNTALIASAIALVSFSFSMVNGLRHGEVRTLANWADICFDAGNYAGLIVFGWIALQSPLSREVRKLLSEESTVTELPSGATVTQTKTTSVQVEALPSDIPKQ